ncbi:MAG TPA: hypothetical protein VKG64_01825 [Methylomirabilota bacterium]|jgi:hypothetical protein|nr:hypothetical protein [Methylomirabilota bacterium]
MRARKLFLLVLAYVAFDLADPVLPGAFSFEVKDSEVEEAIHVQRRAQERKQVAGRPTPPERGAPSPDPVRVSPPPGARLEGPPRREPPILRVARSAPVASARASAPEDH